MPSYTFYGVDVATTPVWDSALGCDAIVGAWDTALVVGVRQDVTFETSTDGVLVDDTGKITHSGFQDDLTLLRAYIRVGVVLGTPVKADNSGPTKPFQSAKWVGVTTAGARSSK